METSTFGGANPFLGYLFLGAAAYCFLLALTLFSCRACQLSEQWLMTRSIYDYNIAKKESKAQIMEQYVRLSYY